MSTLLLGDSHSDIFLHLPGVSRFDLSQCQQVLFTIFRFTNHNDVDLWDRLDNWFAQHAALTKKIVITASEIDIRAHFWRHIPRHYQDYSDISKFVRANANSLYQSLVTLCDKYNLERVVVWSAPIAGERAQYNSQHPFSGSSKTRNQLVHIWNREFSEIIKNDRRLSLATAYYNFIDPETYSTVTPSPSHDGVHWHSNYGPSFWETFIVPALNNPGTYVGDHWNIMYNHIFDVSTTESSGDQKYDTWALAEQINNFEKIQHIVTINNQRYSWIPADLRSLLPKQYKELGIIRT